MNHLIIPYTHPQKVPEALKQKRLLVSKQVQQMKIKMHRQKKYRVPKKTI